MLYTYSILSILGSKSWALSLSYTYTYDYNMTFLLVWSELGSRCSPRSAKIAGDMMTAERGAFSGKLTI
jgi:hypothetical protein